MSTPHHDVIGTAEKMRLEFDLSFTRPSELDNGRGEDLLCFRVSDAFYAMRTNDTAGILVDKAITALPSEVSEYLGVISHRGELIPVYSMHRLLGHSDGPAARWLVLLRGTHVVALTFDGYEGQQRAAETDIIPAPDAGARGTYLQRMMRVGQQMRPIVNIPALLKEIEKKNGLKGMIKEA